MERIIDANLNRATEALRVLEEISRFVLDDRETTQNLKFLRHELVTTLNPQYHRLIQDRDTANDIGREIPNPSFKKNLIDVHKANFKRLQQALRALSEFGSFETDKIRYESYILEKKMYEKLIKTHKKYMLENRKLYLVTDRSKFDCENDFLNAVAAALKGGTQIVQLREKTAPAREYISLGRRIRELCSLYDAVFIVNDRADIAQAVDADGVHLGQDDIDIHDARKILGNDAIVGISTHCPDHALAAMDSGADYIGVGPVYTTPTKPGRQAVGLEYVRWAAENVDIPWFAIGGITPDNAPEVINAGAERVAVVRSIINAGEPQVAAEKFVSMV